MGYFDCAFARIAGRFKRVETRMAARDWLLGVLSDVDTRSCWQLAERAGHASPHRMQRLLAGAVWDADAVRRTSSTATTAACAETCKPARWAMSSAWPATTA
jgi:hypothetical protein